MLLSRLAPVRLLIWIIFRNLDRHRPSLPQRRYDRKALTPLSEGLATVGPPTTKEAPVATQQEVDKAKLDAELSILTALKRLVDGKHSGSAIEAMSRSYRAVAGGEQPTMLSLGK